MVYSEMKSIIKDDLGLSIKEFENLIGYNKNRLSNHSTSKQIPECLSIVFRLLKLLIRVAPRGEILEALKHIEE